MPVVSLIGKKLDLLTHKYRPTSGSGFKCHPEQAARFKQWVQDFMNFSQHSAKSPNHSDYYDTSSDSCDAAVQQVVNKCALLTGPPGVGKTSLVYSIAEELKLHVVESHASEKRDSKLFTMLKLANQKGKINPIAKLFQAAAAQKDKASGGDGGSRRKRRKLSEPNEPVVPQESQRLSLSGDTSIVLFDDVDVVFEEDGPFLKSLVEFIRDSKRPVVVTATQSIDQIRKVLVQFEHIHLAQPSIVDCGNLLKDICKREHFNKLSKSTRCHAIAGELDCDIRQCLNRIHFYGDSADKIEPTYSNSEPFLTDLAKLNLDDIESNKVTLDCYTTSSLLDLMDSRFRLEARTTLRERWLEGRPSIRNENPGFNHDLGEQIQEAILELAKHLYPNEAIAPGDCIERDRKNLRTRNEFLNLSQLINEKIKSRIEPPEKEFFTDIVPSFCDLVIMDSDKRSCQPNGINSRRSRRLLSYLDSISVYLEPADLQFISQVYKSSDEIG